MRGTLLLFTTDSPAVKKWTKAGVSLSPQGVLTVEESGQNPSGQNPGGKDYDLAGFVLSRMPQSVEHQYGRSNMFSVDSSLARTKLVFAAADARDLSRWMKAIASHTMRSYLAEQPASSSGFGLGVPGAGQGLVTGLVTGPDIVLDAPSFSDAEWNSRYQSYLFSPELSLESSVSKGLSLSSLLGSFLSTAVHISQTIAYEYALPPRLRTVPTLPLASATGAPDPSEIYFHQGLLLRLSAHPPSEDDKNPPPERRRTLGVADNIQHKLAGHEVSTARERSERKKKWRSRCATNGGAVPE